MWKAHPSSMKTGDTLRVEIVGDARSYASALSRVRPDVSVLTPSIPERADMLRECRKSVEAQTADVWIEHLIYVDADRQGCAKSMNALADRAAGEWLLPL